MLHAEKHSGPGPKLMGATTLAGDSVVNMKADNLGKLEEIMLDTETGQIAYGVLSFGGFLGVGNKLFAIPWSTLKLDTERKCFVLDVDKEVLNNAPGFDKDRWPDMSDVEWAAKIHSYYGVQPYREFTVRHR
jgi:Uncharacterized conserved protein